MILIACHHSYIRALFALHTQNSVSIRKQHIHHTLSVCVEKRRESREKCCLLTAIDKLGIVANIGEYIAYIVKYTIGKFIVAYLQVAIELPVVKQHVSNRATQSIYVILYFHIRRKVTTFF